MIDPNGFRRGHAELPRRPKAVWRDWTTLRDEGSLQRPLTQAERICVAVAHAEPTHAVNLTSRDLDHEGAARAFAIWLKQINRRRTRSYPFTYFGAIAQSKESKGGAHIHLLAWEFLPKTWVRDRAGFGRGHIRYLADPGNSSSTASCRSPMPLADANRCLALPITAAMSRCPRTSGPTSSQASTIAQVQPQLLSGLQLAKDRSVSDIELLEALPILVRGTRGKRRSTGHGGSWGRKTPSHPTGARGVSEPQISHTRSGTDSSPSSSRSFRKSSTASTPLSGLRRRLLLTVLCLVMAITGQTGHSATKARGPPFC